MNAQLCNGHNPIRDFPYDMAKMYSNIYVRWKKHTDLCRQEIVDLKAEVARLENEVDRLNHAPRIRDASDTRLT